MTSLSPDIKIVTRLRKHLNLKSTDKDRKL